MTTFNAMNIKTFCALPIPIETIVDRDENEWFVLDNQLWKILELPEGARCHQHLRPKEWTVRLLEDCNGINEEVDLISEAGLYMLILASKAQAVEPFKSWVLETVAPTLAEDGLFTMGEEQYCPAPNGYEITHEDIWGGHLTDSGDVRELAERFLPELRKTGSADCEIVRIANGKPEIDQDAFALAMGKKILRKRMSQAKN
jgi:hypothetical protein